MPTGSVLIVEDEAIVAAHLSDIVQKLGYDVLDVVSSGTMAVTRVAQLRPGLVLMDITLDGDKDGIMAAQTIGKHFKIPVIFVTAHTDRNTIDRARATGPSGYVVKPFDEDKIEAALGKALEGSNRVPQETVNRASILIIDDMAHTQATLITLLARKHMVKQSPSTAHAKQMLASAPFDLIIVNIGIADTLGGAAIRELRREVLVETPIIAIADRVTLETTALLRSQVAAILMSSQLESRLETAVNQALASRQGIGDG